MSSRPLRTDQRANAALMRWLPVAVVLGGIALAIGSFWLIISSAEELRGRSEQAAQDAAQPDIAPFDFVQARGRFDGTQATEVVVALQLAQGVDPYAFDRIVLHWGVASEVIVVGHPGATVTLNVLRDEDGSLSASPAILGRGDLVEFQVDAAEAGLTIAPGEEVHVRVVAEGAESASVWNVPERSAGRLSPWSRVA